MNHHDLKCWPVPFLAVWEGAKGHEIRKADRPFAVGDMVALREWVPESKAFTGRVVYVRITYLSEAGTWGLPDDLCVFSFVQSHRRAGVPGSAV